jgi:hypothetical protein
VLYAVAAHARRAASSRAWSRAQGDARRCSARLKAAPRGGGGLRFGGVWTAVIVAQVAVTVASR